jgi:hypothetical protein
VPDDANNQNRKGRGEELCRDEIRADCECLTTRFIGWRGHSIKNQGSPEIQHLAERLLALRNRKLYAAIFTEDQLNLLGTGGGLEVG